MVVGVAAGVALVGMNAAAYAEQFPRPICTFGGILPPNSDKCVKIRLSHNIEFSLSFVTRSV